MKNKISLLVLLLAFWGCRPKADSVQAFARWLQQPQNGCLISKTINGLSLELCYLPYQYMAAQDMQRYRLSRRSDFDSLMQVHKYNLNFLLTVKGNTGQNVLYKGISTPLGYAQRLRDLNFNMESMLLLNAGNRTYQPRLTSMENTYELAKDLRINLLFSPETTKEEFQKVNTLDLEYTDQAFDMGIVHAVFEKDQIQSSLPEFKGYKN